MKISKVQITINLLSRHVYVIFNIAYIFNNVSFIQLLYWYWHYFIHSKLVVVVHVVILVCKLNLKVKVALVGSWY